MATDHTHVELQRQLLEKVSMTTKSRSVAGHEVHEELDLNAETAVLASAGPRS
jgi:hypothetical protein